MQKPSPSYKMIIEEVVDLTANNQPRINPGIVVDRASSATVVDQVRPRKVGTNESGRARLDLDGGRGRLQANTQRSSGHHRRGRVFGLPWEVGCGLCNFSHEGCGSCRGKGRAEVSAKAPPVVRSRHGISAEVHPQLTLRKEHIIQQKKQHNRTPQKRHKTFKRRMAAVPVEAPPPPPLPPPRARIQKANDHHEGWAEEIHRLVRISPDLEAFQMNRSRKKILRKLKSKFVGVTFGLQHEEWVTEKINHFVAIEQARRSKRKQRMQSRVIYERDAQWRPTKVHKATFVGIEHGNRVDHFNVSDRKQSHPLGASSAQNSRAHHLKQMANEVLKILPQESYRRIISILDLKISDSPPFAHTAIQETVYQLLSQRTTAPTGSSIITPEISIDAKLKQARLQLKHTGEALLKSKYADFAFEKAKRPTKHSVNLPSPESESKEKESASSTDKYSLNRLYAHLAIFELKLHFRKLSVATITTEFTSNGALYLPVKDHIKAQLKKKTGAFHEIKTLRRVDRESQLSHLLKCRKVLYLAAELAYEKEKEHANQVAKQKYSEAEKAGLLIECGCCFGEFVFENMVACTEGDLFCRECLKQHAQYAVFGKGNVDTQLKCMNSMNECNGYFSITQLHLALEKKTLAKYEAMIAEADVKKALAEEDCELLACPFCDHKMILENSNRIFDCQACKKASCRYCRGPSHIPLKCEEVVKDKAETSARIRIEDAMTKARLRHCPKCKQAVIKEAGCNKMSHCGRYFCYECRKEIVDKRNPYKHFCQKPHCRHETCGKCKLYSSTEEDDQRAAREAGLQALADAKAVDENVAEDIDIEAYLEEVKSKCGRK